MKVCHLINSLNRGGAETHLLELVTAQSNAGINVDVIVIGEDDSNIFSIKREITNSCNKVYRLNSTSKSYRLKDKTIALKVVCNGDDIISFAERHGADKTAAKLQKSIGNVSIIDTAATEKLSVTFTE